MAEAMLDDEYKSSHTNLTTLADQAENQEEERGQWHETPKTQSPETIARETIARESEDERRVLIQIPPPKRRKISTSISIKDVVDAMNNSMSRDERLDAMSKALSSFDHDNQELHDSEIEEKVDISILKMMVFLEFKTNFRRQPIACDLPAITEEISMALQALEMVYRASSEAVGKSFQRVGIDVLQILVTLIDEEVKSRIELMKTFLLPDDSQDTRESKSMNESREEDHEDSKRKEERDASSRSVTPPPFFHNALSSRWAGERPDGDLVLKMATKILGHFARVGAATKPMARFPGLLGSTLNLINMRPYDAVPWEARLSCLWAIANLSCHQDNMRLLLATPGLLMSLVQVGFRPIETSSLERTMEVLRARSIASRALLNLSWPPENKILLSENSTLLAILCKLAIERNPPYRKSKTMQDIMIQTRRHAIGCIRNLAAAPRRTKIVLCEYEKGKILDILTEAALNDSDQKVLNLTFAAIHNLAIHDTAEIMVDRPALVLALKNVLDEEGSKEVNSPGTHASSTLLVLERSITPEMPAYQNLRELLDVINPSYSSEPDNDFEEEIKTAAV